jgi:hypothetical protein
MKKFGVVLMVLLVALAFAVPASAAKPVVYTGDYVNDWTLWWNPCSFEVKDYEVGTYHWSDLFDRQGNYLGYENHTRGTDSFYNPLKPDLKLSGEFAANYKYDVFTDVETTSGSIFHVNAKQYDLFIHMAGRIDPLTEKEVGTNFWNDPEEVAKFCALLQ